MLRLRKFIEKSLNLRFMDGEDGAAAGAPSPDLFNNLNVPEEIRDDPDMIETVEQFGKENPQLGDNMDNSGDDAGDNDDGANEESNDDTGDDANDDTDDSGDDSGENAEKDQDDDAFEFENDISIGEVTFNKDSLGKLPADVLQNIGSLKTHVDEMAVKLTEETQKAQSLLEDPIVAYQAKRIAEGKANQPLPTIGVSTETKNALLSNLQDKHGLSEDEAGEVFNSLRKEIEADIQANADAAVKNSLTEFKQNADAKASKEKSYTLLGEVNNMLAEVKPELALKDANIAEIIEQGTAHPQYAAYKNGVGQFFEYWSGKLNSWKKFSQMSSEEVYLPVAAKMGLTIAMNTQNRDTKIQMSERNKMIESLGGKKVARAMSQKPAPGSTDGGSKASLDNQGGVDKERLNDSEYVDNLLASAKTDDEIFAIQKQLTQLANA